MAEPWLDSLSEDWKSEHHSSSPNVSVANTSSINSAFNGSQQSRIPHLRQSLRKDSVKGHYLQPRSTKGLARSKTSPVLAERSASSLNVNPQQNIISGSEKQISTLPRRASSAFSDSQQSVQHHSLAHRSTRQINDDVPEWRKRLARGEDVAGEGVDLFGPSKLEGVFKQPPRREDSLAKEESIKSTHQTPWTNLSLSNTSLNFEEPHTFRSSRARPPGMEVVEELSEDEGAASSPVRSAGEFNGTGSVRGFVKDRVDSLERKNGPISAESSPQTRKSRMTCEAERVQDPRWRTISGQAELLNEDLSPVTVSKQNTIRDRALKDSVDLKADELRRKLSDLNMSDLRRPSSSSSDQEVQYGHQKDFGHQEFREESNIELTTHSLPEDLSMGTQEFMSNGGFVSNRRGGYSNENSFQRKALSSAASSHPYSRRPSYLNTNVRSSPPPYADDKHDLGDNSRLTASLPATPTSASVVRQTDNSSRPLSSGSPLKLFGNRDTYTNNKLMRVLSHFEDADDSREEDVEDESMQEPQQDMKFRMSEFGKGELDEFHFEQATGRHELAVEDHQDIPEHVSNTSELQSRGNPSKVSQIPQSSERKTCSGESTTTEGTMKRMPNSPRKDRTPKRRRTLLRDELQIPTFQEEPRAKPPADTSKLAGTKHTDSRSEMNGAEADPGVLASRSMLRPRSTKRRSSTSVQQVLDQISTNETSSGGEAPDLELTQALAAELATFTNGVTQAATDSRKPSLATKDYMEEANKVMQFIRAKGKPKTSLPNIDEPSEISELNPDAILDLDIDADSTKDSFSRPPSREGPRLPRLDQRTASHDAQTANHLRRFQDQDDFDLVANTSVLGTLHLVDNQAASEAALVPASEKNQESSPPNMRILNSDEMQRKRKHSASTLELANSSNHGNFQHSHGSSDNSTNRTFPTASSQSSGQRGIITSGAVSIPDQIGRMTFDHSKKMWVKERDSHEKGENNARRKREPTSEEDPFENIPDLSIEDRNGEQVKLMPQPNTLTPHAAMATIDRKQSEQNAQGITKDFVGAPSSLRSQVSEHELSLHNGVPSSPPKANDNVKKQPRVVTIAFSSPLVSAINYNDESGISDADLDAPDDLPIDDSELPANSPVTSRATEWAQKVRDTKSLKETSSNQHTRHDQYRAMTLNRRPVSRIEEDEEEEEEEINLERSIVHVANSGIITPAPQQTRAMTVPRTGNKGVSIIALTPLSEFTVHQVDNARDPEESFVGKRAQPKSLRQAHGSLALAIDELVRAITDTEPSEVFWEQVRRLDLTGKGLRSLYGLSEYCLNLEELTIRDNQISQLNGVPGTLRVLNIQDNTLSNLTSWGDLQNLQYVKVSGNQLESLNGFGELVHLRDLNAENNNIHDIDGVLDLNGLLRLKLSGNKLTHVNFQDANLGRLKYLDLSRNCLTAIRNLHALTSLEELNVEQNDLRSLSIPEAAVLESLRILRVSGNQLEFFDLKHFPALEELYLDNNRIQRLEGLQDARNLQLLSLRDQGEAPDIINFILSTPSECHELRLSSNNISSMIHLPQLPQYNVRVLEMACCGISVIPQEFGDSFPNCRELNLNFNAVKELSPLQGMVKLRKLLLAGNRVKRLRRTCLALAKLGASSGVQEVDLRENPLTLGFYTPLQSSPGHEKTTNEIYALADGDRRQNAKWMQLMDKVTGLKRRMFDLMLAEGCTGLEKVNGLPFEGVLIREKGRGDAVWDSLMVMGVLKQAPALPGLGESPELDVLDQDAIIREERSLVVN